MPVEICQVSPEAPAQDLLQTLLDRLEPMFRSENRPGGEAAAEAIRTVGPLPELKPQATLLDFAPLHGILARSPHHDLIPLMAQLSWRHSGLNEGRIRPDLAAHMLTSEIIGPTGMIPHDTVKVGLFYQSANLDYVTRTHAAEETFHILAGTANWSVDDAPPRPLAPGTQTFHASMAPHYSVTGAEPTLAAWRWTGDIRMESYALHG